MLGAYIILAFNLATTSMSSQHGNPHVTQSGNTITVSPNTDGPGGTDQFRASEQPAATLGNSGPQDGRTEWPELLGMDCTDAKQAVEESNASLKVYIVPPNSAVTLDYQTHRVRIISGEDGKVRQKPTIG